MKPFTMPRGPLAAAVALILVSAGCGGGGGGGGESGPQTQAERIQYAQATAVGKGWLADYMKADWLYDNYFGHLGLPPEVRPRLLIEMQRLANGFALQFGLGEDVVVTTNHFHDTMNSAAGQAMLARFASRMLNGDATLQLAAGARPDAQALALQPVMSALDRTHAAAARVPLSVNCSFSGGSPPFYASCLGDFVELDMYSGAR